MNFSVLICDQQLYTLARSSPSHYWINFTVDRSMLISWGVISLGLKHISNMKWKLSSPNTETEQFMQNKQNQGKYHFILWKYRLFFNLYSKTHFILMSRKIFRKKNHSNYEFYHQVFTCELASQFVSKSISGLPLWAHL